MVKQKGENQRRQSNEEKPLHEPVLKQKRKAASLGATARRPQVIPGSSKQNTRAKLEVSIAEISTEMIDSINNLDLGVEKFSDDESVPNETSHHPSLNSTMLLDTTAHYSTAEESPPPRKRVQFYEHVQEKEISDYSSMSSNSSTDTHSLFESFSGEDVQITGSESNSDINISANTSDASESSIIILNESISQRAYRLEDQSLSEDVKPSISTALELMDIALPNSSEDMAHEQPPSSPPPPPKKRVHFNPDVYEIVFIPEEWMCAVEQAEARRIENTHESSPNETNEFGLNLEPIKEEICSPKASNGPSTSHRDQEQLSPSPDSQDIEPPASLFNNETMKGLQDQLQAYDIYKDAMEAQVRVEKVLRKSSEEFSKYLQELLQAEVKNRLTIEEENSRLLDEIFELKLEITRRKVNTKEPEGPKIVDQSTIETADEDENEENPRSFSLLLNSTKSSMRNEAPELSESMEGENDGKKMSNISDSSFELNETCD